jgi:hypothetical protein
MTQFIKATGCQIPVFPQPKCRQCGWWGCATRGELDRGASGTVLLTPMKSLPDFSARVRMGMGMGARAESLSDTGVDLSE